MAVSVLQSPTTPNVTGTNLVYTLSSSLATSPQFRYVTDIYESGSNDYITTIKTYPNIHGSGIIDVAKELDDQLGYDYNWKVTGSIAPVNTVKTFNMRFGEEYGTSISSSVTTYTGSSDNYLEVFPGSVFKNEGSYNLYTSSIADVTNILSNTPIEDAIWLSLTDYHTVTNFTSDRTIDIEFWGPSGQIGSPYVINADPFVYREYYTWGVGPQNLIDLDPSLQSRLEDPDCGEIRVWVNNASIPGELSFNYYLKNGAYSDRAPSCRDEHTRFAFINQYGFWDYYNVYNPLRRTTQVDRSLYSRPFVRYEDPQGLYNINNRGNTQYKTDYRDNYEITTDWLDEEVAEWLKEMFVSQEVYIQVTPYSTTQLTDFVPINITNTTIQRNLSTSRNKLFQYTIQFKYANDRQTR